MEAQELIQNLINYGVGRRKLNDKIFAPDKALARLGIYDEDNEDFYHSMMETPCIVPGCKFVGQSLLEFENHYNSYHRYSCITCKKSQPSRHLLDLHIQESHDSFFSVMAAKKPSYSCYIEECTEKFQNAELRFEHCLQVHKLPKDFRFDYKPKLVKKKKSKNKNTSSSMDVDRENINSTCINFSNSKTKTFKPFKKFTCDKTKGSVDVNIDQVMTDLQESLPIT
ncbi:zinc finger protein 511 [Aricia agestis]|uniref:zinc finger protein 511 n=1 Tax=Aricia agestis TaxID=91739 RepID=UPI001C201E13|nr:zinc finger protein 511 [Aricia agestis]XP_041972299.1 zinc finger protein 511 [Aricia agestis]